jgi:type IV pilus assembly protein PilX
MIMPNKCKTSSKQQQGAVLIVSLLILLVLTLLGVTAMQNTTLEERMAGNTRDLQIALNAAEAGLRAGEEALRAPSLPAFDDSGAYHQADTTLWKNDAWWFTTSGGVITYTTNVLAYADSLPGVAAQPAYYLEKLPATQSSGGSLEAGVAFDTGMYRVTARGVGVTDTAVVILQSAFRR